VVKVAITDRGGASRNLNWDERRPHQRVNAAWAIVIPRRRDWRGDDGQRAICGRAKE